jgi:hypothetical protein
LSEQQVVKTGLLFDQFIQSLALEVNSTGDSATTDIQHCRNSNQYPNLLGIGGVLKIVRLLLFVPSLLFTAYAAAQNRIMNISVTNSLSE